MTARIIKVKGKLPFSVIGQVVQRNDILGAVKVKVEDLKLDTFLNMYFAKHTTHWASDPHESSNNGDIVYIKKLEEPKSDRVHHYVKEVVFKVGQVIDPVTGRRCRGTEFINEDRRKFEKLLAEPKAS